jgi:single-stranded-DNA-specific exonuclease
MPLRKRWRVFPSNNETVTQLSRHLNLNPIIAQILLNRRLTSLPQVKDFLGTGLVSQNIQLDDSSLIKSWSIVRDAIAAKARILVYGDYDVDGMTSTAMMVACLRFLGADVRYYIPNRFTEGYGLNINCVTLIKEQKIGLLITLDCGVTSITEISAIKDQTNASVIVMDHHTIPDQLPPFDVMVNPQQLPDTHYLSGLCTAGIVYYWIKYAADSGQFTIDLNWFLCLAAVGTVADVASLTKGNRVLVRDGLIQLSQGQHLGIQTILEQAKIKKPVLNTRDIGFAIAPRLNASGRLSTATLGVQLLLASSKAQAYPLALQLEKLNHERRAIDNALFQEASEMASQIDDPILVLYNPTWHPGVIGITASKLVDQFSKPAVLMTNEKGVIRGSARASGTVSIYQLLKECQSFFSAFGGHTAAAGFSLKEDNYPLFKDRLVAVTASTVAPEQLLPVLSIDAQLDHQDITLVLANELDVLDPFGQGNDQPIFYSTNLYPVDFRTVGDGRHLKVVFRSPCGKNVFEGIGFGMSDRFLPLVQKNSPVSVAYHLTVNEWRNDRTVQLQLLDIQ